MTLTAINDVGIFAVHFGNRVKNFISIYYSPVSQRKGTIMVEKMTLPETGFVRLPVVLHRIPVSKTTWWNGVKSGRFPASVKLGEGITVWKVEDIRTLIGSYEQREE